MGDTDVLRRFNRTYTQRIGALDESFLGLGLPLGAARLVFEIGEAGATARELRSRLGLDSGHLARQLRRLEDDGLVHVAPDPADRRRRTVRLSTRGRALLRRLDDRSEQLAERLIAPLTDRQRRRLTDALATADLLVRAATVEIRPVHPADPTAVSAVQHYFRELRRSGSPPGSTRATRPTTRRWRPAPAPSWWRRATESRSRAAGSRPSGPRTGEIKRMWVHPGWRGAGLGSRLLRHLEQVTVDLGYPEVKLDTNGTLVEAIAMYERAGYRRTDRYNDNPYAQAWFVKDLRAG